jgi:hypothetical protein
MPKKKSKMYLHMQASHSCSLKLKINQFNSNHDNNTMSIKSIHPENLIDMAALLQTKT